MKCEVLDFAEINHLSLSSRRAWIEIDGSKLKVHDIFSRSPHGERGLKLGLPQALGSTVCRRSPHGERGLKLQH